MLELLLVLALVLMNGFFAMSEMALMTSRKSRLKQMAATSKRATKALALAENPENFLSAVQIGITLTGVLTGLLGGDAIGDVIGERLAIAIPALPYAVVIGKVIAVALITAPSGARLPTGNTSALVMPAARAASGPMITTPGSTSSSSRSRSRAPTAASRASSRRGTSSSAAWSAARASRS